MKKKFTFLFGALCALMIMISLPGKAVGQTRAEEVYKTSLFGTSYNSQGVSSYTGNWYSTTNGFRLDIVNANNNNNQWSLIKIGGKNGAYTGTLTTHDVIDEPVTKVVLTIDAIDYPSNLTSMKLYSSSNNSTWTEIGTFDKSVGAKEITVNTPTANLYYKIEVACTKASKNGVVAISKVEYYHNAGSTTYTVTYNANDGSDSPDTFVDDNDGEGYEADNTVIVLDNDTDDDDNPSFTKTGFSFSNWNTAPDCSGTPYDSETNNEIEISGNVTLYAIWAKNTYNVAVSSIDNVILSATYGTKSSIVEGGNADIDYDTEITLSATGLAPGKAFVWDVYKKGDTSTKVPVTNNKFNVPAYDVIISGEIVDMTYNNTYTSNVTLSNSGGTSASTCKVAISVVEYDGIKAGTGSVAGAWQVTVPANTTKLHLHLAGWNGEKVTLSVTPSGYSNDIALTANSGISGSGLTYTFNGDPSTDSYYKIITFAAPLEEAVTLTFSASSGNRFVVWGVNAEASTNTYITADDVEIEADETSGSITYMVHNIPDPAGTLKASTTSDWLTLDDIEENVPFTCAANPDAVERTATVTLTYSYGDDETTSLDVTVTQAPKVVTYTYTLATSIESGKHYIITNGGTMIMDSQGSNNRSAVNVSKYYDNGVFSILSNAGIYEFIINGPDADGYYTIHDAKQNTGYLYANGNNSNNYLKTQSFNSDYGRWNISINNDSGDDYGKATIVGKGDNANKYMRYNSSGWFSCYGDGSSVTALPYLYVRDDTNYEFYMDIAKYTTPSTGDPVNGWNFIALPLASAYTLSGSNLVAGTYDLYRLNNTTWENYKNNEHSDFTTLNNGTGYLYANSANVTLHFSGAINTFTTEENANQKVYSEGWNLIGNPYNIPVYINKPYYTLNAARNAVVATAVKNVAIAPCTGVIADGGTIIFTEASQNVQAINNGNLQMVLAHKVATRDGASVNKNIDNAIVSFNEGSQLEKFYFGNPSASIFIPQNGEDYAIAFSDRQGDVPLYFKANETGTYTISFAGDEMSLNGIYLIDILAEEEIDLSVNPSYTFIGSPADRMARFKIVFRNANGDGTSDIFAYQNGNDIIVSGEGELQIFDVMGRMVSRQYVSGVEAINILTQGVYIMKLNDKTQKIVVR